MKIKKRGIGLFGFGLLLILYPTLSNGYNQYHQSQVIDTYVQEVNKLEENSVQEMLERACEYNQSLLTREDRYHMTNQEYLWYENCLNVNGSVMASIEIKKIHVNLPIYHGTSEEVLQQGIGHIEASSLPVGGINTHCVLIGHRGLPKARLFTDLDQLEIKDTFQIHVLNETHVYEIFQIKVVLPEELEDLKIEQGKDIVSLITCTPYGVNTHRLIIQGKRMEPVFQETTTRSMNKIWILVVVSLVGIYFVVRRKK